MEEVRIKDFGVELGEMLVIIIGRRRSISYVLATRPVVHPCSLRERG
jgi:hypothetical protein